LYQYVPDDDRIDGMIHRSIWKLLQASRIILVGILAMIVLSDQTSANASTSMTTLDQYSLQSAWQGEKDAISPAVRDAITLISFYVEYYADEDQVFVIWETATELDTSGFRVWRAVGSDGTYQVVSPFIQAEGGLVSMYYEWEDVGLDKGFIYYYKLEEIDINNVSVNFFGPIQFDYFSPTATATVPPTATATATLTPAAGTPSVTPQATRTPTATVTRTLFPTSTRPVSTAALTPGETDLGAEEESHTAVPAIAVETMQPVPADELKFPAETGSVRSTELAMLQPASENSSTGGDASLDLRPVLTSRIWFLGLIVLLLWVVLAASLVYFLRKLHEN
jgi:hypothetical protein